MAVDKCLCTHPRECHNYRTPLGKCEHCECIRFHAATKKKVDE